MTKSRFWAVAIAAPLVLSLLGLGSGVPVLGAVGAAISLVFIVIFSIRHRRSIVGALKSRRLRSLGNDGLHLTIALGVAILAWALIWVGGWDLSWDMTANRQNSLDPITVKILAAVKKPVEIEFHHSRLKDDPVLDVLKRFCKTQPLLKWTWVDMVRDPLRSKERGVDQPGTLVLLTEGRQPLRLFTGEMVRHGVDNQGRPIETDLTEERLAGALQNLQAGEPTVLGFLGGDGEKKMEDGTEGGLARLRETLRLAHFRPVTVKDISAASNTLIPILAIMGPREPLTPARRANILEFIAHGGHLLLALDPRMDSARQDNTWEDLARELGVGFRDDMVVDPSDYLTQVGSQKGSPVFPILSYGDDPITALVKERGFDTVFFSSRSFQTPLPEGCRGFLTTGPQAMGLGNSLKPGQKLAFDPLKDVRGPLPVAVRTRRGDSRIIALGDSDFLRNPLLEVAGHRDLAVSMFRHLAGRGGEFVLPMRPPAHASLSLKESTAGLARFVFLLVLPLLLLSVGIWIALRRRRMAKGGATPVKAVSPVEKDPS